MSPVDSGPSDNHSSRELESVIETALGDSVTPARLREYDREGKFLSRVRDSDPGPGPVFSYIGSTEQPHYVFRTEGGFGVFGSNDHIELPTEFRDTSRRGELFSSVQWTDVPAVCVVSDESVSFLYGYEGDRVGTEVVSHDDIINADVDTSLLGTKLQIATSDTEFYFRQSRFDSYTSEIPEAAGYISDKADQQGEYTAHGFAGQEFNIPEDRLREELDELLKAGADVDITRVVKVGGQGAVMRGPKDPRTMGLTFVLSGGYELFSQLYQNKTGSDPTVSAEDIDPTETAETVSRFQEAGPDDASRTAQIGLSILGSAVSIAEQAPEDSRVAMLSVIDPDMIPDALEAGGTSESGIELATNMVESYSEEFREIIDEDFFRHLDDIRRSVETT